MDGGIGEVLVAGSKLYARCAVCRGFVRLNKPLLGSLHICITPEEEASVSPRATPASVERWDRG